MEGLIHTSKDKEEGSGGKTANFFVAIAFDEGVITCEQYHSKLTGTMFAEFVKEHFSDVFKTDPRQCSKVACDAMDQLGCRMFAIPRRSPDVNPIENIFHLVRKKLQHDALRSKITKDFRCIFRAHKTHHEKHPR